MREIRQSGSEGGVAVTRHPYPYNGAGPLALLNATSEICVNLRHLRINLGWAPPLPIRGSPF